MEECPLPASPGSLGLVIKLQQVCYKSVCNLAFTQLLQLAASLWIKRFDNQLATTLLATCNSLVVDKLYRAMRIHPDIGSLMTILLQNCTTCLFFGFVGSS